MEVVARSIGGVQVEITSGHHRFMADEPGDPGQDAGPDPYALLLSALGACTAMTLQLYAARKGWPLEGVEVRLSTYKVHAQDCEICESSPDARVDIIERKLRIEGNLSPEQIKRLKEIAERCPVHRTLTTETKIVTTIEAQQQR